MTEPSASQPFPPPPADQPHQAPPYPPPYAGAPTAVHPGFGPNQHLGYAVPPPPPQAPPPARRKRRPVLITLGVLFGALLVWGIFGNHGPKRLPGPPPAASAPVTTPGGEISEAGTLSAIDLQPGDCFNAGFRPPAPGSSQPISTVEAVPCASPHTDQVVAKIGYQSSDDWADVRANRVGPDCAAEFKAKIEKKILTNDDYVKTYLFPADFMSWKQQHAAACVVSTEQPTTGSVLKS
jgi:hypothetical protein